MGFTTTFLKITTCLAMLCVACHASNDWFKSLAGTCKGSRNKFKSKYAAFAVGTAGLGPLAQYAIYGLAHPKKFKRGIQKWNRRRKAQKAKDKALKAKRVLNAESANSAAPLKPVLKDRDGAETKSAALVKLESSAARAGASSIDPDLQHRTESSQSDPNVP